MASTPSKTDEEDWPGRRIDFARMAETLEARKKALGFDLNIPRNAGKNRTPSKKALLKAIKDAGGQW